MKPNPVVNMISLERLDDAINSEAKCMLGFVNNYNMLASTPGFDSACGGRVTHPESVHKPTECGLRWASRNLVVNEFCSTRRYIVDR